MGDIDIPKNIGVAMNIISTSSSPKKDEKSEEGDLIKLIADIATGIWRIHMGRAGAKDDPQRALNYIFRNEESIWNLMAGRGIEIKDHTGKTVDAGDALNIVAYQPSGDLTRNTVIETLRPTIYFRGRIIQTGEVIVGRPEKEVPSED